RAPVHHRTVPDADPLAHPARKTGVGVQDAIVLHVGATTDVDAVRVRTDHAAEPQAGPCRDAGRPDHRGVRGDPGTGIDRRLMIAEGNVHALPWPVAAQPAVRDRTRAAPTTRVEPLKRSRV